MGTSGTEGCEGCLSTQFKHLLPQLALRLILVRLGLITSKVQTEGMRAVKAQVEQADRNSLLYISRLVLQVYHSL